VQRTTTTEVAVSASRCPVAYLGVQCFYRKGHIGLHAMDASPAPQETKWKRTAGHPICEPAVPQGEGRTE
jgi:hypothetical protein